MFNTTQLSKEKIFEDIKRDDHISFVKNIMTNCADDGIYHNKVLSMLDRGEIETRCFVSYFAKNMSPKTYLEIGVRLGWSLITVAKSSPSTDIFGFDFWYKNYARAKNPGPDFVRSEINKHKCQNKIELITGNSRKTIPEFFKKNRNTKLDLALVDGDHSAAGAEIDIENIIKKINVGGVILFDDIVTFKKLEELWCKMMKKYTNFIFYSYLDNEPGVGIAIRQK